MAQKLIRKASGVRHLTWLLEILATMDAHIEINDTLTPTQLAVLNKEADLLRGHQTSLQTHVSAYRTFLSTAHVSVRAHQRVANYLCDEVMQESDGKLRHRKTDINALVPGGFARIFSGLPLSRVLRAGHESTVLLVRAAAQIVSMLPSSLPGIEGLADRLTHRADTLDKFNILRATNIESQRTPLRLNVERASLELREGLEQMDGRLRSHFTQAFIDSLYPELNKRLTRTSDGEEEDEALPTDSPAPQP